MEANPVTNRFGCLNVTGKKAQPITSKLLHFLYKWLFIGYLADGYDKMTVTSSHGSFNKPSICCARSQLCQLCAGSPVTVCPFFYGPPCGAPPFSHYTSFPSIFSLGAEKQLKPLLAAANSATFPGCVLLPSARARHGPSVPSQTFPFQLFSSPRFSFTT